MAPGSVIVDLAAERGGNCELTQAGKTVKEHGVTIIGQFNIAQCSYHAARCMRKSFAFLLNLVKDGKLQINEKTKFIARLVDTSGEIVKRACTGICWTKAANRGSRVNRDEIESVDELVRLHVGGLHRI